MSRIQSPWPSRTIAIVAAVWAFGFAAHECLHAEDVSLAGEWPPVRSGIWTLESTRILPSGKERRWSATQQACHASADLFMTYWGLGRLKEAGCRYYARKLSSNKYEIDSECMVGRYGKVESKAIIDVPNDDTFQQRVTVKEGPNTYSAQQTGKRLADCTSSDRGRAK